MQINDVRCLVLAITTLTFSLLCPSPRPVCPQRESPHSLPILLRRHDEQPIVQKVQITNSSSAAAAGAAALLSFALAMFLNFS